MCKFYVTNYGEIFLKLGDLFSFGNGKQWTQITFWKLCVTSSWLDVLEKMSLLQFNVEFKRYVFTVEWAYYFDKPTIELSKIKHFD